MNKPWGTETLLTAPDSPYCMKVLEVRRGERLSLQSHTEKHETLYLAKGEALLTLDKDSRLMLEGETVVVPPMTPHRVAALTRCVIYEASTPETGTTIRHEDDYGRGDVSYD
jgi:mannose-6-phosphate isomerase-like protein (cupin superfamily)